MFSLLFKYPIPVFTKGHLVFLSGWPAWLLLALIVVVIGGLALLMYTRLRDAAPLLRTWRAWALWGVQSALIALLLLLLWRPALSVAELSSQQNIIAVVLDNSKSMATPDANGKPRESAALTALQNGVLAGLNGRFRTRLYTLGGLLNRVETLEGVTPTATASHIGDGLQQLATETADLPVGAVVLLTDGSENSAGCGIGIVDKPARPAGPA